MPSYNVGAREPCTTQRGGEGKDLQGGEGCSLPCQGMVVQVSGALCKF